MWLSARIRVSLVRLCVGVMIQFLQGIEIVLQTKFNIKPQNKPPPEMHYFESHA